MIYVRNEISSISNKLLKIKEFTPDETIAYGKVQIENEIYPTIIHVYEDDTVGDYSLDYNEYNHSDNCYNEKLKLRYYYSLLYVKPRYDNGVLVGYNWLTYISNKEISRIPYKYRQDLAPIGYALINYDGALYDKYLDELYVSFNRDNSSLSPILWSISSNNVIQEFTDITHRIPIVGNVDSIATDIYKLLDNIANRNNSEYSIFKYGNKFYGYKRNHTLSQETISTVRKMIPLLVHEYYYAIPEGNYTKCVLAKNRLEETIIKKPKNDVSINSLLEAARYVGLG